MNKKVVQTLYILLLSSLLLGCNSNGDSNHSSSTVIADLNESISETIFQEGLIVKETTIEVKTDEKELLTTVTLEENTQFEDANGVAVTEAPILVVKTTQEEDVTKSVMHFNSVTGEEIVTPTKAFKVGIKAPSGAKPGDKISVKVPDSENIELQKIIIRIVNKDGFVFFEITIHDRKNSVVTITMTLLGNGATN